MAVGRGHGCQEITSQSHFLFSAKPGLPPEEPPKWKRRSIQSRHHIGHAGGPRPSMLSTSSRPPSTFPRPSAKREYRPSCFRLPKSTPARANVGATLPQGLPGMWSCRSGLGEACPACAGTKTWGSLRRRWPRGPRGSGTDPGPRQAVVSSVPSLGHHLQETRLEQAVEVRARRRGAHVGDGGELGACPARLSMRQVQDPGPRRLPDRGGYLGGGFVHGVHCVHTSVSERSVVRAQQVKAGDQPMAAEREFILPRRDAIKAAALPCFRRPIGKSAFPQAPPPNPKP